MTDPFDVLRRSSAPGEPDERFVERVMGEVAKRLDSPGQQERHFIRPHADFMEIVPMHAPTHHPRRVMAAIAGAVAAVAIFVTVALVATHDSTPTPSQTASTPLATTQPQVSSTVGAAVASQLLGRWMSGTRSFLTTGGGVSLLIDNTGLQLAPSNVNNQPSLTGGVRSISDGVIVVSTRSTPTSSITCANTQQDGTYTWKLSASGRQLEITALSDRCVDRSAALVGSYSLMGCIDPHDNCLGSLDPGTYGSQFIRPFQTTIAGWTPRYGGIQYTVPDGWANFSDFPDAFGVSPAADFSATSASQTIPAHSITVFSPVAPITGACDTPKPVLSTSLEQAVAAVSATPGITVSAPTSLTVDGHRALAVDIARSATLCPNGSTNVFLSGDLTDSKNTLLLDTNEKARVILVDLHDGAIGENGIQLAAIWIDAVNGDGLDAFSADAMKVIETMHFS